jgi:hypothetical protein
MGHCSQCPAELYRRLRGGGSANLFLRLEVNGFAMDSLGNCAADRDTPILHGVQCRGQPIGRYGDHYERHDAALVRSEVRAAGQVIG